MVRGDMGRGEKDGRGGYGAGGYGKRGEILEGWVWRGVIWEEGRKMGGVLSVFKRRKRLRCFQ